MSAAALKFKSNKVSFLGKIISQDANILKNHRVNEYV